MHYHLHKVNPEKLYSADYSKKHWIFPRNFQAAKNIRRTGDVNHDKQGVFLFNFFYADNVDQNLGIWEYTAGWFEDQTGLHNSTLLRTQEDGSRLYSVINHCRWDKLSDVLPSLIFKRTFKTYVLANLEANNTAPTPILYKLA